MKRQLETKDVADEPETKKIKLNLSHAENRQIINLPSEILETIAAFINDERARRHLRVVCKKWLNIMNYTTFTFSPILSSEIEELVSVFSESKSLLDLRLLKTQNRDYQCGDIHHLSKLTQLTSFVGHFRHRYRWDLPQQQPYIDEFLSSLTNLESLDVSHIHCEKLSLLTKLRCLKADGFRMMLSDPVVHAELPNLRELSIYMTDLDFFKHLHDIKHFTLLGGYDTIRELPFTALESLTVKENVLLTPLPATLTRLEIFHRHEQLTNIDHLTNLKHLEIETLDNVQLDLLQNLEVCRILGFKKKSDVLVEQLSLLPRLRDLRIGLQDKADKCLKTIGSMTALRAMCLYLEEPANPTPLSSLTNLKLLTYGNVTRSTSFDWLKQLTSLVELDLSIHVDRRLPRESLNLTPLHNLTRLVFYQIGVYAPHCLTSFTNLLDLKLQARSEDPRHQFAGLSTLTQLTSLEVVFQTTDDDWQEITQLTNLRSLAEIEYIGNRSAQRLLDLTVMQKLTRFVSQELRDVGWNFTALTSLQYLEISTLDHNMEKVMREKLPYLENTPPRFVYDYL